MRGKIEKILSKVDKGKGWVITALVDGEEVSGWQGRYGDEFKVGDEVSYYFDDRYNKAKMNPVHKPLQEHNGYDSI